MAGFSKRILPGLNPWESPAPMCRPEQEDVVLPFSPLVRGTPGPVGINDPGQPDYIREYLAEQQRTPIPPPAPAGGDPALSVSAGQVTFDAEGSEDARSPYFSRHIHWPGNELSGVTLGRGYDMGNRTEQQVTKDLVKAGLLPDKAAAFAKGAGKKGTQAQKFVQENRVKLGLISTQQQKNLFELIYPDYVARARMNYDKWTQEEPERFEWDDLDPVVRDILVDFVYQGFTKGPRPMQAGMNNDAQELIDYIESSPTLSQYEAGRRRAKYLRRYARL